MSCGKQEIKNPIVEILVKYNKEKTISCKGNTSQEKTLTTKHYEN